MSKIWWSILTIYNILYEHPLLAYLIKYIDLSTGTWLLHIMHIRNLTSVSTLFKSTISLWFIIINMLTLDFMVTYTPGTRCSMYERICKKRKVNLLIYQLKNIFLLKDLIYLHVHIIDFVLIINKHYRKLYYYVAILLISLIHNFIHTGACFVSFSFFDKL